MSDLFDITSAFLEARRAYWKARGNLDKSEVERRREALDRAFARLYAAYGSPFGSSETGARLWREFLIRPTKN